MAIACGRQPDLAAARLGVPHQTLDSRIEALDTGKFRFGRR